MRNNLILALLVCDTCMALPTITINDCLTASAGKYGIHPHVLWAIAATESSFNPAAIGRNKESLDIGLMQINSGWLPRLERFGISRQDLLDPCTNIDVGTWILAHNIQQYGYGWQAIGAYNAVSPAKRSRYAQRIWQKLQQARQPPL